MDMIGIGPPTCLTPTPLAGPLGAELSAPPSLQVPNDELTTLKAVALTRLVCPGTNIPATTGALDPRSRGRPRQRPVPRRQRGDAEPHAPEYRALYQIYPGKAGVHETADVLTETVLGAASSASPHGGKDAGGRRGRASRSAVGTAARIFPRHADRNASQSRFSSVTVRRITALTTTMASSVRIAHAWPVSSDAPRAGR